jgi:hypothetical protein
MALRHLLEGRREVEAGLSVILNDQKMGASSRYSP